jgi:hypothetical protein
MHAICKPMLWIAPAKPLVRAAIYGSFRISRQFPSIAG